MRKFSKEYYKFDECVRNNCVDSKSVARDVNTLQLTLCIVETP